MNKNYFGLVFLSGILFFISSCSVKIKTANEVIELKGFQQVKGRHCESTSIMNALNYQGLILSEAMINGLAGSPDFNFFTEGAFPFMGTRSPDLLHSFLENTGLVCVDRYPDNPQAAYDEVKDVLKNGIPVVLQLDMRFLPYRWGGKYAPRSMSFGSHFVTLIKLDEIHGFAWVTETHEKGIYPVEKVKISDLMKARGSKGGIKILHPNYHYYYFIDPKDHKINYGECLKHSIKKVIDNYKKNNGTLSNIKNLPGQINNIENIIKTKYILQPLFHTFYGWIEIFGTGGSAFRNFYRDYLYETAGILNNKDVKEAGLYADNACREWCRLAYDFKEISDVIKTHYNDKKRRDYMYSEAGKQVEKVYEAEVKFINKLEELYKKIK